MSGPTIPPERWALAVPAEWWEAMGRPSPGWIGPVKLAGVVAVVLAVTKPPRAEPAQAELGAGRILRIV
ncbi:MAG: hypothetical protein OXN93_08285 [bacterium]|nr:hypothetical protein [bacterium]